MIEVERASEHQFLVLAPSGRDAALTCKLLLDKGMGAAVCSSMSELCTRYQEGGALGLMIAEEALTERGLAQLTQLLEAQPPWSDVPILVFVGRPDGVARALPERLMNRLGNVSLLDRPLRPLTMISAANAAHRSRNRQYAARAALREREQAIRQRDQFLAMLGHELRNPLSAISMAAELACHQNNEERDIILRQTRHLTRLVDDLLDVARVTSGKIVLKRAGVDLRQVVERALEVVQPLMQQQRLEVWLELPNEPVFVDGDQVRLEQVVGNLLTNAAKYTPEAGRVEVRLQRGGTKAWISVRDNGMGISQEMLARVFDLFTQAEGTLDRAKGGMGIGLTLVRNLVELHGGTVHAESAGIGQGSTFSVCLPVLVDVAVVMSDEQNRQIDVPRTKVERNVLIVEDNDDSRELLAAMLKRRGHHVSAAEDGNKGVALAMAVHPDVLLVDIGLPGLDGYGVARKVRSELGADVYLVALSGYGQPEDRARALEAGFNLHLTKPVDFAQLERVLAESGSVVAAE